MRVAAVNIRLMIALVALLVVITIGTSYLEYRSSRTAVLELFRNQAELLINAVAQAGEKALVAYQSLQRQIRDRLYTVAVTTELLRSENLLTSAALKKIKADNEIADILIVDPQGTLLLPHGPASGDYAALLESARSSSVLAHGDSRADLGIVDGPHDGSKVFAVALRDYTGGAIIVAIDASELLLLRRTLGPGSAVEDIARSTGVRYAAILNNGMVAMATKGFPSRQQNLADTLDDWYKRDSQQRTGIATRLLRIFDNFNGRNPGGSELTVFEAVGEFNVAGQYYGDIVIGIDTGYLDFLTSKLKRDVLRNAALSLIISLVAIAGIIIRQNYKLLSSRYVEVEKTVRRLEADKAVKDRFTALGELAAGVAHQIKNPLNSVSVIAQRLERELKPREDLDEYRQLAAVVRQEADRIRKSVDDYLKLSRPDVHKALADLNQCVEEVLTLFSPRAAQNNIEIKKNLNPLPRLNLDTQICREALMNVLDNAMAAVGHDGAIEISTRRQGKSCVLDIGDSGPGIPEEMRSRIFNMYFTTKTNGTGMGLPYVLMMVKEHGGTIEISDSHLGGALFTLELPIEH